MAVLPNSEQKRKEPSGNLPKPRPKPGPDRQQDSETIGTRGSGCHGFPLPHLLHLLTTFQLGVVSPQAADGPELRPQTASYPGTQEQDSLCECFRVGTALSTRTQPWAARVQADPHGLNASHTLPPRRMDLGTRMTGKCHVVKGKGLQC